MGYICGGKMPFYCSNPKITIITPSFNQGEFIEETILSVLNQNYPNLEYIIIDGGSTDSSVDIIKKYGKKLEYWVSEPDGGQTDAIKKGCNMATGDIIGYLNSDDLYYPNSLMEVADYFRKNPDIVMVYGDALHINREGSLMSVIHTGQIDLQNYLSNLFYIPQPAVFFRTCVFDEIGYFDISYHLAMDKEYWTRIMVNYKIGYLPKILAKLRIYDEAKSSSEKYKYLAEHLRILDWFFTNIGNFIHQKDNLKQIEINKEVIYGSIYFSGGMEYLKIRNFKLAFGNIVKGLSLNPRQIFLLSLYWSIFVAIFGQNISSKVQKISRSYRNSKDPLFNIVGDK
ncbi:glycosyltransferase family 2 protein [Methanoplanus endosymbiosus]|uniref:Glycosyltransferase n=1 Tax=Methanoplanus endosymbiosus TaxID=33865 RepID=A0A9E7PN83_9EURY|nr:glycosyltransferase family 2 protein [Methanoplanus endosymbiosus]UUX91806.1 glycosyltransferase [Methanoplanus endosymbiosus]